jgi:hypothetical protein
MADLCFVVAEHGRQQAAPGRDRLRSATSPTLDQPLTYAVMKNFAFLADLSRRVSSLRRDQRGVSAVEFAMLLPLMITLYLGCVEVSQGVAIHARSR